MSDKKEVKRNFKLWNHWIAEVREIALDNKVHSVEEDSGVEVVPWSKSKVRYFFDKLLLWDDFKEGKTPQEAFENCVEI